MNNITQIVKETIKKNQIITLFMVLLIGLTILISLIPPLVLEQIMNHLSIQKEVSWILIIGYFVFIACSKCFEAGQNSLITVFGQKIIHGVRSKMNEKINQLPANYFSQHESASITSILVNDVDTLDVLFSNGIISMFADAFRIMSILVVIFYKSKGLGIIMVIILPALFWMTRSFQKRMLKAQIDNRKAIAKVNAHIPETIKNSQMIRNFSCQPFMEERYDLAIQQSYKAIEKANLYDSLYSPIVLVISSCVIAIMMVMAAMGEELQLFFGISAASSVALIAYVNDIFTPLESIGMEIQNIQSAIAGMKRIHEFLNEEERGGNDCHASYQGDDCVIRFDHVSFGYDKTKVINDLSFEIKKDEMVTLIGVSGAGKSTIFKLICGFYEPQSGSITINGVEAYRIADNEKRKLLGYVKQSFDVVKGSIKDQITLYDETISVEQINQVLELVGLKETVDSLKEGMDTPYDSTLFSLGQVQLLSIARSLVYNPPILLLDEISANLDSNTEKRIHEALNKASKNRTVLSISHRLFEQNIRGRLIKI